MQTNETQNPAVSTEYQDLLIRLLRAELTETDLSQSDRDALTPQALPALYQLAKTQDLAHLVANQLSKAQKIGKEPIDAAFRKQAFLAVYRSDGIEYETEQICKVLQRNAIAYILLKGSVIREFYPKQSMRTSCDIDILVTEADAERASACVIEALGYQRGRKNDHDISLMSPNGVHFELHFSLLEGDSRIDTILGDVWSYAKEAKGASYLLQHDFFLFYHIAHMAKHFNNGGCGIRPFMDLWIMEHKMHIDRHCADALLQQTGLATFAQAAFALSDIWFGQAQETALAKDMQEYLLNASLYGSIENYVAVEQVKKGSKFRHILGHIFLSYRQMLIYYPSLKKCPILFPFYQIRRWGRILFCGGAKDAMHQIKVTTATTEEKKEKIHSLYQRLGL